MAGGFRGSEFLLWPSYRSRSHDLWSGIWMEMTRSCDLREERSNLARFGRRRFPLLQFKFSSSCFWHQSPSQVLPFGLRKFLVGAAIRSQRVGSTGHLFSCSARNAHEDLPAYRASGRRARFLQPITALQWRCFISKRDGPEARLNSASQPLVDNSHSLEETALPHHFRLWQSALTAC